MAILLIAEHDNQSLSDQTAKALSAAQKIGSDIDVLVAGNNAKAAADAVARRAAGLRRTVSAGPPLPPLRCRLPGNGKPDRTPPLCGSRRPTLSTR